MNRPVEVTTVTRQRGASTRWAICMRRRAAIPERIVIRPPNHNASRAPGRLRCTLPNFTEPSVIAFDNDPNPLATNGPIVSESSRQTRTTVYKVANVRPRMSSLTLSCSTVNPVTYAQPAPAPNERDE